MKKNVYETTDEEINYRIQWLNFHAVEPLVEVNQVTRWKLISLALLAVVRGCAPAMAAQLVKKYDMLDALRDVTATCTEFGKPPG